MKCGKLSGHREDKTSDLQTTTSRNYDNDVFLASTLMSFGKVTAAVLRRQPADHGITQELRRAVPASGRCYTVPVFDERVTQIHQRPFSARLEALFSQLMTRDNF